MKRFAWIIAALQIIICLAIGAMSGAAIGTVAAYARPLEPCYRPTDPVSIYYVTNGCQPTSQDVRASCPFP